MLNNSNNDQPKWLAKVSWVFEKGDTLKIEISGKRFVILKFPGHKYWSDRLNPSAYAPVEYYLTDKKAKRAEDLLRFCVHEGRLTKKVRARLKRMCELSNESNEMVIIHE